MPATRSRLGFGRARDAVHLTLPPGRPEAELIEIVDTAAEVRRNTVGGRAAA